jgi:hypothetical protein
MRTRLKERQPMNMIKAIAPSRGCLLWVTEYGIWPSSENLHLYYKLRSTYNDHQELRAAPGHFFLAHERDDLVTFVELVLRMGWGAYVLPILGKGFAFIAHDGWLFLDGTAEAVEKLRTSVDTQTR